MLNFRFLDLYCGIHLSGLYFLIGLYFWITAFTALVIPSAFSRNAALGTGLLIHITVHFCGGSDSPHPQLWALGGEEEEHKMGTS